MRSLEQTVLLRTAVFINVILWNNFLCQIHIFFTAAEIQLFELPMSEKRPVEPW